MKAREEQTASGSRQRKAFCIAFAVSAWMLICLPELPESAFRSQTAPRRCDLLVQDAICMASPRPSMGNLQSAFNGYTPAPDARTTMLNGAVDLNGISDMLRYDHRNVPRRRFFCLHCRSCRRIFRPDWGRCSARGPCRRMIPLRICAWRTANCSPAWKRAAMASQPKVFPCTLNTWMRVAVVKEESTLTLYVDGDRARNDAMSPSLVHSQAKDIALGGNPHYARQRNSSPFACPTSAFTRRAL